MKTNKKNETEEIPKENLSIQNEIFRKWSRDLNTHGDAHVRYLTCKRLMTMEEVEPWLEALYKIGPIPAPELKALSLLASALSNCPSWDIEVSGLSRIPDTILVTNPQVSLIHHHSEDTVVILDLTKMIKESGWHKEPGCRPFRKNDSIRFSIESTASGELVRETTCIEIGKEADSMIPMLDACASFVLWAENGFSDAGTGINRALLYSMDPSLKKKHVDERLRIAREERHRQDDEIRRRDFVHQLFEYELNRIRSKSWEDMVYEVKGRKDWFENHSERKTLSDYFAETILQRILESDDPYQDLSLWRVNPDSYTLEKKSEKEVAPKWMK